MNQIKNYFERTWKEVGEKEHDSLVIGFCIIVSIWFILCFIIATYQLLAYLM